MIRDDVQWWYMTISHYDLQYTVSFMSFDERFPPGNDKQVGVLRLDILCRTEKQLSKILLDVLGVSDDFTDEVLERSGVLAEAVETPQQGPDQADIFRVTVRRSFLQDLPCFLRPSKLWNRSMNSFKLQIPWQHWLHIHSTSRTVVAGFIITGKTGKFYE